MADRLALFIDYQNVHFGARDLFMPYGEPAEKSLVHPGRLADLLPAVQFVFTLHGKDHARPRVEVVCRSGAKRLLLPAQITDGRQLPWCHFLSEQEPLDWIARPMGARVDLEDRDAVERLSGG